MKTAFVIVMLVVWCVCGFFFFRTEYQLVASKSYTAAALVSPICLMLIWAIWIVVKTLVRALRGASDRRDNSE